MFVCLYIYTLVTKSNSKSNEKNKNKANKRYGYENRIIAIKDILMALNFLRTMKDLKVRAHENSQVREILKFSKPTFLSMQEQLQRIANDQISTIHDTLCQVSDWKKDLFSTPFYIFVYFFKMYMYIYVYEYLFFFWKKNNKNKIIIDFKNKFGGAMPDFGDTRIILFSKILLTCL
ncbi:hypothetical protein RFI_31368 [Reticulomyxa filosa]|uniref:Uncharacterized protein n=1 Tax=Reticulomyxa filosa TaxID=46433 RepID=X6LY02_RETFI|nr:hypothetical protein RFI_31368 [Reticulomyxa filosa]|eukprot:ETO06027.1 hypothetical protein RFI_31368 [Reticulomyxa filosa]